VDWLLTGLMMAENDIRYRELCKRESLFWRLAMPVIISSIIFVGGLMLISALMQNSGLF